MEDLPVGLVRQRQISNTVAAYTSWCLSCGLIAFPPSYQSLAGYLVVFVSRQQGSARSIANVKSHLHVHCRKTTVPWLSEADAVRLTLVEKNLLYYDVSQSNRKRPLIMSILISIVSHLNFTSNIVSLQLLTTLFFGHNGLLRGGKYGAVSQSKILYGSGTGRVFPCH